MFPLVCYPQGSKAQSWRVLQAFADGCQGQVFAGPSPPVLEPGAAAFWGVVGIEHLLRLAIAEKRDWFYGDNSFFDAGRGRYFRVSKNCIQVCRPMPPDQDRLKALGVTVAPWRKSGRHIVVIEQSEHFLELVGQKHWLLRVLTDLSRLTDRPVKVRRWSRDKAKAAGSLKADLDDAWCLITHMSAAANEALLHGVPVFVSGLCAATPMAGGELAQIESPRYPDGREEWAAGLAGQQWTIEEIRSGMAWRALNDSPRLV